MASKGGVPKRLRKIVEQAESQGWTYDSTKAGHPRLNPPRGLRGHDDNLVGPVTFAKTSSDWRGDKNAIAALRRAGVNV